MTVCSDVDGQTLISAPCAVRSLESLYHLFWECSFSKSIWGRAMLWAGCGPLRGVNWGNLTATPAIIFAIMQHSVSANRKGMFSMVLRNLARTKQPHIQGKGAFVGRHHGSNERHRAMEVSRSKMHGDLIWGCAV